MNDKEEQIMYKMQMCEGELIKTNTMLAKEIQELAEAEKLSEFEFEP